MDSIQYIWKDRKCILGMPITFTCYLLGEDADHMTDDELDMMEDPFHE